MIAKPLLYDPDDVGPRDSPPPMPMKINLAPSPKLASVHSPISSLESPRRKGQSRAKNGALLGDAVLVGCMGGGRHMDIALQAGERVVVSDGEAHKPPAQGTEIDIMPEKEGTFDLAVLAMGALRASEGHTTVDSTAIAHGDCAPHEVSSSAEIVTHGDTQEDAVSAIALNLTVSSLDSRLGTSPETLSIKTETRASPPAAGELPPILHSPHDGLPNGNGNGSITLPSISAQLGDINHLADAVPNGESTFSQSPSGRQAPRFTAPGHGSPQSPNDTFTRRELPSPAGQAFFYNPNSLRRPSQVGEGTQYISAGEYSSSNTETPSTDQSASTPATTGIDRMSIDGITNPQIGGFQCTYPGCTAQPFATQYLLNSHANVHSSNRPHYCMVKGCPRGEGGKGFKRKNEMIRHGLVHDSPGYVCPFCPDREHKYPRPDNLQRHVRVHHVDKDKDDVQLREVLSQRPEGPSRGRRRRINGSS